MFAFDDINQFAQDNSSEVSNTAVKGQVAADISESQIPNDIRLKVDFQVKSDDPPASQPVDVKKNDDILTKFANNANKVASDAIKAITNVSNETNNYNESVKNYETKLFNEYFTQNSPEYLTQVNNHNEDFIENKSFNDFVKYYDTKTQEIRASQNTEVNNSNKATHNVNAGSAAPTNPKSEIQNNSYFSDMMITSNDDDYSQASQPKSEHTNDNIIINNQSFGSTMNAINKKDEAIRQERETAAIQQTIQLQTSANDARLKQLEAENAALKSSANDAAKLGSQSQQLTNTEVSPSQSNGTNPKPEVKEQVGAKTLIQQNGADMNTMLLMQIVQLLSGKLKTENSEGW